MGPTGRRRTPAIAAALLLGAVAPLAAQQLTLGEALARAELGAYANRLASAGTAGKRAEALAPLAGVLPAVRLESGYMRTTDPVAAFGTTLRQRRATQAAFDPARLNDPAAAPNYVSSVVVELPVLNADAWLGRGAASRGAAGAALTERWQRESTRLDVVRAYWGAVLSNEQTATLESGLRAAQEHVRQATAMVRNGLATKSDALLAEVKSGDLEASLAAARGDARTARLSLAVLLGAPDDTLFTLPANLPSPSSIRALALSETGASKAAPPAPDGTASSEPTQPQAAEAPVPASAAVGPRAESALAVRADVLAAQAASAAASVDRLRARSRLLPRVNAFARYDWNSPNALYAGRNNWTFGVMGTWTPIPGAAELAENGGASAGLAMARTGAEAAEAQAKLEQERSRTALAVALERLDIAERGVAQAAEAHRIVERKYAGGLATVVELLDAAATETGTRMTLTAARYDALTALAAERHAFGEDPGAVAVLEAQHP